MKKTKKMFALLLTAAMILSSCMFVFAASNDGSVTVSNATKDKAYAGYRIFDAEKSSGDGVTYTIDSNSDWYSIVNGAKDADENELFTLKQVDGSTKYRVVVNTGITDDDILDFFKGLFTYDNGTWTAPTGITPDLASQTATDDGELSWDNVPYGYYLITSNLGSLVSIDTNAPDVKVIDKNQTVEFDKNIVEGTEEVEVNEVHIGEKINYVIRATAPNYNGSETITNYFVYDKMDDSLLFNNDIIVKVNGTQLASDAYEVVTGNNAHGNTFEINIPWTEEDGDFLYEEVNNEIVVTYSATVTEDLKLTEAMENEGLVKPKSVPDDEDDKSPAETIDEPDDDDPWEETRSYSTAVKISKIDAETSAALTGAKFSFAGTSTEVLKVSGEIFVPYDNTVSPAPVVYYKLKDGKYTDKAPVTADYMEEQENQPTAFSSDNGGYVQDANATGEDVVTINDVKYRPLATTDFDSTTVPTVYTLVKANADKYDSTTATYMKKAITAPETVKAIDVSGWVDENGIITFEGLGEGEYTITELVAPDGYNLLDEPISVKVTFDDDDEEFSAKVDTTDVEIDSDGYITFTVANTKGELLPSTGGMGTTIFYLIGSLLVLAAAVLLLTKKRVKE